ncbi:hypothetical protein AAEO56_14860 [Flavobacterium sp. DGU11]|uniref:Uncharacterized protein n=1 Tax=Flavobacterium arundinis TaxID=3139143 RepID=A0ABU9HZH3_9FLAO
MKKILIPSIVALALLTACNKKADAHDHEGHDHSGHEHFEGDGHDHSKDDMSGDGAHSQEEFTVGTDSVKHTDNDGHDHSDDGHSHDGHQH